MNESQRFYINTTLEMLDQQWKEANIDLEEIYKEYSTDRQALKDKLSKVMMEFNIKEEYMDIKSNDRIKLNKELQQEIRGIIENEKAKETEGIKKTLENAVKNGYKYKEYILGLGIDFNLLPLSEKEITRIVNQKIKGELWSSRLWSNKKDLEMILRKSCDDFIKGKISVNKIGQQIRANFETDFHKSQRLARTELARVQGAISDKFDKDHDVEWQLWISTLDGKTSKKCRGLDGTQYRIDDKNKPTVPAHPNCRSCLVGIPHKDYKPTTRRDNETGDIIDYVTYDDWKNGVKPVKKAEPKKPKATPKPKNEFKPATSIKEANDYAIKLGVNNADYKGIPLEVANEWNRGLFDSFNKFEKLRENFEFVGAAQERNKLYKKLRYREVMEEYKKLNPSFTEKQLEKYVIKHINRECGRLGQYTWAESTGAKYIKGVSLNANTVSKSGFITSLKNAVATKFHPIGCDTVKSVLDHEIGHQLDGLLGISKDKAIRDKFKSMTKEEIKEQLSEYSYKNSNKDPVREFVAEAWAEYCNNPKPRPIAQEIGEMIEGRYKEWIK